MQRSNKSHTDQAHSITTFVKKGTPRMSSRLQQKTENLRKISQLRSFSTMNKFPLVRGKKIRI